MLRSLFLNWIPAALLVAGALYYVFGIRARGADVAQSAPVAAASAPAQPEDPLLAFARDFSSGDPAFIALVETMRRTRQVPVEEAINPDWGLDPEDSGAGANRFATVLVNALTGARTAGAALPLTYFDWKEDVDDTAAQFDQLFERLTGRPGNIVSRLAAQPEEIHYAPATKEIGPTGVLVATSYAIAAFNEAGYTLLHVDPGFGWDAYLIAALPHAIAANWSDGILRMDENTTKEDEVRITEARLFVQPYVATYKPEGLPLDLINKPRAQSRVIHYFN